MLARGTFREISNSRGLLAVLVAGLVLACEGPPPLEPTSSPVKSSALASPLTKDAALHHASRGLALALSRRPARQALIAAMRASPWVEHKLELLDYVTSPEGQVILRSASDAMGVGEEAFSGILSDLPTMDLYVVGREARRSWRGSANVLVVGTWGDGGGYAYDTRGVRILPTSADDVRPYEAVILIHAAEPKAYRFNWMEATDPQGVISNSPRQNGGLVVEYYDQDGRLRSVDVGRDFQGNVAEAMRAVNRDSEVTSLACEDPEAIDCDDDGGGSGGGGGPSWGTYASGFFNKWIRDGTFPLVQTEAAEVELKFWRIINGAQDHSTVRTLKFYDAYPGDVFIDETGCPQVGDEYYPFCVDAPVTIWADWAPFGSDRVEIHLMEIDGNGLDEVFHIQQIGFDSSNPIYWEDDPLTLDKCHDDSGFVAECADGFVRYFYE